MTWRPIAVRLLSMYKRRSYTETNERGGQLRTGEDGKSVQSLQWTWGTTGQRPVGEGRVLWTGQSFQDALIGKPFVHIPRVSRLNRGAEGYLIVTAGADSSCLHNPSAP